MSTVMTFYVLPGAAAAWPREELRDKLSGPAKNGLNVKDRCSCLDRPRGRLRPSFSIGRDMGAVDSTPLRDRVRRTRTDWGTGARCPKHA